MKQTCSLVVVWLLVTAGPATAATVPPKATGVPIVGPEVEISPQEDFAHVETMLVVNPRNALHLMASCIALPKNARGAFTFRARTYVSLDSGRSWRASVLPEKTQWDPVIAFASTGTPLLACLVGERIKVFRSPDTGLTWDSPVSLPEGDHPMMAVDTTAGPHAGTVYVAACNDAGDILVHRSIDDGKSFATTVAQKGFRGGFVDNLVVLPSGALLVPLRSRIDQAIETLSCTISTNGGRSFSPPASIVTRSYSGKGHSGNNEPAYAVGVSDGKPRLFCVFGLCRNDVNSRVMIVHSDDHGRTWSEPRPVVDDVPTDITHGQANVMVNAVGVVGISFLERKIGTNSQTRFKVGEEVIFDFNETYDLSFTASLDGGKTFCPPINISTAHSRPRSKHASRFMPGTDYMLASPTPDGSFHLLWPDARSGIFQLYTRTVHVE